MLKPTEKLKKKKDSSLKPSTYPFKKNLKPKQGAKPHTHPWENTGFSWISVNTRLIFIQSNQQNQQNKGVMKG